MVTTFGSHDWRDRKVRDWLLLLLSFAVTREPADLAAALAVADELDSLGVRRKRRAPSFFLRTSNEVCEAILAVGDGHDVSDGDDNAVLRRHVARIEDPRLRRAFEAAVGLRQTSEPQQESAEKQEAKPWHVRRVPSHGLERFKRWFVYTLATLGLPTASPLGPSIA